MSLSASDELTAALRRSLSLIIGLMLLGLILVNVVAQIGGPSYQAVSKVEVPAIPLSEVVSGTQPAFVDPQRSQDTAASLAQSPQVYQLASASNRSLGSGQKLQTATKVAEVTDTDIISFTSSASSGREAKLVANAVAQGYITFSSRNATTQATATMAQLRQTLATLPPGSQKNQVQSELNHLALLNGASSSDATVVQSASSADKTSPAPAKDSVLGVVLGLVVGLIITAVREAVDGRVRNADDVQEILATPVMTRIRPLPKRTRMVSFGSHQLAFADAYSMLASQLVSSRAPTSSHVIAVTSSIAQEGKTTTAANLSVAIARRGASVILVDFDFRRPDVSTLFKIPADASGALQVIVEKRSLASVLWEVSLSSATADAVQNGHSPARGRSPLRHPGLQEAGEGLLRVLPAGGHLNPGRDDGARVTAVRTLIGRLREAADVVVIDTPPTLLTSDVTDLSDSLDSIVLVVRQGHATRRNLKLVADQTHGWGTSLTGAVLTDAPQPAELAAYYGAR
jgi:Mrp family chromosome partitioning ATPase